MLTVNFDGGGSSGQWTCRVYKSLLLSIGQLLLINSIAQRTHAYLGERDLKSGDDLLYICRNIDACGCMYNTSI